jgi:putative transposase
MKYEWLFREEIDHGLELIDQIGAYRHDYNHIRPHEAIAWNRPADVHAGLANPTIPNFETEETLPTT